MEGIYGHIRCGKTSGRGLALARPPPFSNLFVNTNTVSLNINQRVYITSIDAWPRGGPGVEPRGLHIILINHKTPTANKWVPRGSPSLGHVAPFHCSGKMPRVATLLVHHQPITDRHISCQGVPLCHVTATCGSYGLPSQHFFSLFDLPNRSLYLSLPTSV
jgi:hypothetical protein